MTPGSTRPRPALTDGQRELLRLFDNPMGRCGWPLSVWQQPGGAADACRPLIKAGLLRERRLGGYPGAEITDAGRKELQK